MLQRYATLAISATTPLHPPELRWSSTFGSRPGAGPRPPWFGASAGLSRPRVPIRPIPGGTTVSTSAEISPLLPGQRWRTVIEGATAIVIGLLLLALPSQTLLVLVQLLGIYWLVTGVVMLASLFIDQRQWGWKLLLGVLGVIAGLAVVQLELW